jgi:cytoskeletal protein RodZ
VSILVKAASGLVAGLVVGALGVAFLPRVEPTALQPRHAVEKPQFVVGATARDAPRAAPAVAVAAEAAPAKPSPTKPSPAPALAPPPAAAPLAATTPAPVTTAKAETPKPAASATTVAVAAPANEVAARWSVQGLVALAKGDLASARQFLTLAADAGDPRAWVALADTYDPAMLSKLGVVGAPGDAQRARDYLVKAASAGLVVAKDRVAAADQNSGQVR